jgi:tetratricopeptide (TPR) repeat protein
MDAMNCEEVRRRQMADEYRAGRLTAEESTAYEEHFFSCDRCFEDLRFRDGVAEHLRWEGAGLFASEIRKERRGEERAHARTSFWDRLRPVLAAFPRGLALPRPVLAPAAVLFLAVVLFGAWQIRESALNARLRGLWAPSPYPFIAAELRGSSGSEAFAEGMQLYNAGRYAQAADRLGPMLALQPADPDGQFYCGVADLLAGRPAQAAQALREAVRLTPASAPYRWYLAQAELKCGRSDAARAELERIVENGREYAPEARTLLEGIDRIKGRK